MVTEVGQINELLLIDGCWVESRDLARFEVLDPANGAVVGTVPDAGAADIDAAIAAASKALRPWRRLPARERGRILLNCAAVVRDRLPDIAFTMTREQGKPLAEAKAEVEFAASFFEWFAGEGERAYGQMVPAQRPDHRVVVLRQPVGVSAAITPWNFPAAMMSRKLAPALAAGCTSIIKPASATPLTAAGIVRCMQDAGVPDGVVNLITSRHSHAVAKQLFDDARVRKVSFTGSTEVGKELIRLSSAHVTRLSLELGGHSPYLVFADADLDLATEQIVVSKFRNSGQTCVCANRAYVQRSVYEELVERVADRSRKLVVGSGLSQETDMGPLIDGGAVDKVEAHINDAVGRGARLVTGGERLTTNGTSAGNFFGATILADTDAEMLISREETFGPALAMAPFDSEEDAVRLANDTQYGLAAYVHTRDYGRLFRVAEELEYGIVGVDVGIISAANAPFAGIKESGYGVEGGSFGIDEYLATKYVLLGDVS